MAENTPESSPADDPFAVKPFAAGLLSSALAAAAPKASMPGTRDFRAAHRKRLAGKDLFAQAFHEFSRWTHEEYHAQFIERLPHRLLQSAAAMNPELRSCRGFAELGDLFASVPGRRWNNPELYPFLNYMNLPSKEVNIPTFLQSAVNALRIHVGLDPLRSVAEPPVRFWRLREPAPAVFQDIQGLMHNVEDVAVQDTAAEPFPVVYRPYPHLFDDIDHRLYRGEGCQRETKQLGRLAREALQAISRYCQQLAAGFCRAIGTVAFLCRPPGDPEAGSFSKRNYYIGGIFVSLGDAISVAEQFIHEYYHQTIWPWWLIEPPADLPADGQILVSPITGRARPLLSMMQGLLINYSLIDYYRFILAPPESSRHEADSLERARARLAKIEGGIGALLRGLQDALAQRPHCSALVEFIASTAEIHGD